MTGSQTCEPSSAACLRLGAGSWIRTAAARIWTIVLCPLCHSAGLSRHFLKSLVGSPDKGPYTGAPHEDRHFFSSSTKKYSSFCWEVRWYWNPLCRFMVPSPHTSLIVCRHCLDLWSGMSVYICPVSNGWWLNVFVFLALSPGADWTQSFCVWA